MCETGQIHQPANPLDEQGRTLSEGRKISHEIEQKKEPPMKIKKKNQRPRKVLWEKTTPLPVQTGGEGLGGGGNEMSPVKSKPVGKKKKK